MTRAKDNADIGSALQVQAGKGVALADIDPQSTPGAPGDKLETRNRMRAVHKDLNALQEVLYAESKRAVLIVLQALDTGGKDGTIRKVFGPMNPQGVRVTSFKAPSADELAHDFLWRIHHAMPGKGMIGIHNRSHYEDVLVPRVHTWVSPETIEQRYEQINNFEKHLSENGITILKFYLHISRDEQKKRLRKRLDKADKHWKFNTADLQERKLWDEYIKAYDAIHIP